VAVAAKSDVAPDVAPLAPETRIVQPIAVAIRAGYVLVQENVVIVVGVP